MKIRRKKQKSNSEGPTIHELDSADLSAEDLLHDSEGEIAQVDSPVSSGQPNQSTTQVNEVESSLDHENVLVTTSDLGSCKPENLEDLLGDTVQEDIVIPNSLEDTLNFSTEEPLNDPNLYEDVLMDHPNNDPFFTNIMDGSYNSDVVNEVVNQNLSKQEPTASTSGTDKNLTLAKCYPNLAVPQINSIDDLHNHQETTQTELDQFKEFLSGYNGIDSKYLLNLFNEMPSYGLTTNRDEDHSDLDVLTGSGSELAPYEPGIDLNELFQDSRDGTELVNPEDILGSPISQNQINSSPLDLTSLLPADE
uniref:Uncharacterized protein n=1 Tax=Photinus pyralis TaxID=7054 RepID=A0A1Y1KQ77_PHOPY